VHWAREKDLVDELSAPQHPLEQKDINLQIVDNQDLAAKDVG
jgi:hypothetical protein